MSVACFLSSWTDLLCSPRIAAGEALCLVTHLVSCRGSWKHRLKQNYIFSLVHWKRSLTPCGNTSHAKRFRFFTRPDVRTGLTGITTPHFAYEVKLWVNSLIPLTGKQYKMKEHTEKSPIPFFLQTSLSLLPAPQLDVKRTIWKGLKV